MNVQIRDPALFRHLSHLDVRAYLAGQQWTEAGRIGNKATVHTQQDAAHRTWEILLPSREDVADYPERMAEALHTLAQVEGRSELLIYRDLLAAGADVLRVAAPHAATDGTIAIQEGVLLHQEAENLLLAAACAAVQPRPSYHAGKVTEAVQYLETVRLGPSETGSYVITLLSPVAPVLRRHAQQSLLEDEPFPRQVTHRLVEALDALEQAANAAAASDDFAAFETRVSQGISANLCEAVARLAQQCHGIRLELSWARVRPAGRPNFRRFFSRETGRLLGEAAREFRRNEPRLDCALTAWVIRLDREPDQFDGRATLRLLIDNRPRHVSVKFEQSMFDTVIHAFRDRIPISLDGDLFPVGQRYELGNPRNLALVQGMDEPDRDDPLATVAATES
ncbi:hypothetical protein E4P82_13530 [Candidatus Competibacter phosphatis]|uniref:Uncharacterized protein n=1 Tax=Candidatus Competibacter phosphatis TaxID=221280 RepID=A0ABX1TQ26_9GAMM|nr:hypothetical protein [Candidatus Competibacter phosphatis]NMQ20129.1 hypothetical protein [Candidatus Competibacter phosphatis]